MATPGSMAELYRVPPETSHHFRPLSPFSRQHPPTWVSVLNFRFENPSLSLLLNNHHPVSTPIIDRRHFQLSKYVRVTRLIFVNFEINAAVWTHVFIKSGRCYDPDVRRSSLDQNAYGSNISPTSLRIY